MQDACIGNFGFPARIAGAICIVDTRVKSRKIRPGLVPEGILAFWARGEGFCLIAVIYV